MINELARLHELQGEYANSEPIYKTALAMVFKLLLSARKKWRRLNGSDHLAEVIQGVRFEDGIKQIQNAADDLACVCQRYLDGVTRLRYCTFSAVWAKITN